MSQFSAIAAPVLLADRWIKNSLTRSAVLVLGLTALTALSAQFAVPLPFTPVPLTLQTFAVLVGAATIGSYRAVLAQILYVVLAIAGLPVLAGGASGIAKVVGATGGYLVGFIVASYFVGLIAKSGATKKINSTFFAYAIGTVVIYTFGAIWLMAYTDHSINWAIANGVIPFLIGDVLKAIAAGLLLPTAWKLAR